MLCIPASDEADEVTAAMLALLLEHSGCVVLSFTPDPGLHQLAFVQPAADDIFCISALPPFAFAHARTLSHQLRVRYPGIRIIVGVWGFAGETERAMERFQAPRPDKLVTSLADAIQAVMIPDQAKAALRLVPDTLLSTPLQTFQTCDNRDTLV